VRCWEISPELLEFLFSCHNRHAFASVLDVVALLHRFWMPEDLKNRCRRGLFGTHHDPDATARSVEMASSRLAVMHSVGSIPARYEATCAHDLVEHAATWQNRGRDLTFGKDARLSNETIRNHAAFI
jgi:hypothetical protein